jgi:hypothetical protein
VGPVTFYEFHPLADCFPLMTEQEAAALRKDVKKNGLLEPITLLDGKILDGRNRSQACANMNVKPRYEEYEGDDPVAFVVSKNLHRRNLTAGQRDMASQKLATMRLGDNQYGSADRRTLADVAKLTGATERGMDRARKVEREGVPELVDRVNAGRVALDKADKIASLPREKQEELMKLSDEELKTILPHKETRGSHATAVDTDVKKLPRPKAVDQIARNKDRLGGMALAYEMINEQTDWADIPVELATDFERELTGVIRTLTRTRKLVKEYIK